MLHTDNPVRTRPGEKRIVSAYKEYSHTTAIFTPLGSSEFAAGALGLWSRLAVGGEPASWCKMVLG